jgi:eukaryotic-like serine/threonine-protein kinase
MNWQVREGDIIAGKYRVDKQLGAGGMGVVLAARHTELGQRVAIKVMHPELADNADAVARFTREGQAAARLRSSHVARVLDVGRLESGAPYLVLEYLEGRDLSALLTDRGALPVTDAVHYLMQACEAVAEAHAAGIVHRDLKPANLFLTEDPYGNASIKVLDFGISKLSAEGVMPGSSAPSMTATSAIMGSPLYMPPEQMRSTRSADARSDIWAMGAIFYELVTAKQLWEGDTFSEVCVKVLSDPTPSARALRPELPEAVDTCLMRCLEKDPARRYQSVAELAAAIAPLGGDQSVALLGRVYRLAGIQEPPRPVEFDADRPAMASNASGTLGGAGAATATKGNPGAIAVPNTAVAWGAMTNAQTRTASPVKWVLAAVILVVAITGSFIAWNWSRPTPIPTQTASRVPLEPALSNSAHTEPPSAERPVASIAASDALQIGSPATSSNAPPIQTTSPIEPAIHRAESPPAALRQAPSQSAKRGSSAASQPGPHRANSRNQPNAAPAADPSTTSMPNWGGRQ